VRVCYQQLNVGVGPGRLQPSDRLRCDVRAGRETGSQYQASRNAGAMVGSNSGGAIALDRQTPADDRKLLAERRQNDRPATGSYERNFRDALEFSHLL
jgi:hypothetical protein